MSRPLITDRWQPQRLLKHAFELPCDVFVRQHGHPFYLVVVLDSVDGDLARGLAEANANDAIAFRTIRRGFDDEGTDLHASEGAPHSLKRPSEVTAIRLLEMAEQACFVVPLCKSARGAFLSAVSVGRARNHDVVLRHPTVSKFHATFELSDRLFLKDVGSRNHTLLNYRPITERLPVQSGDHIRFGAVNTLVCTAGALWNAVHAGP